jgi:uncharacterized membrane protein YfcA
MSNDTRHLSARARVYLVIGITTFAVVIMLYLLRIERNSAIAFLESHLLPILVVATLSSILSGWAQARAKLPKAGIFLKSVGRGLTIFVAGAAFFLKLPETVLVTCLALGVILSVIGTMVFRTVRRRLKTTNQIQDQERPPTA